MSMLMVSKSAVLSCWRVWCAFVVVYVLPIVFRDSSLRLWIPMDSELTPMFWRSVSFLSVRSAGDVSIAISSLMLKCCCKFLMISMSFSSRSVGVPPPM